MIKCNSTQIVLADMQKRVLSLLADEVYLVLYQQGCITLAEIIRMCADGADFCKFPDMQPLTCHGHQFSFFEKTEVVSEVDRTGTEWAGFGEFRQPNHFFNMFILQSCGLYGTLQGDRFPGKDHLQASCPVKQFPTTGC